MVLIRSPDVEELVGSAKVEASIVKGQSGSAVDLQSLPIVCVTPDCETNVEN